MKITIDKKKQPLPKAPAMKRVSARRALIEASKEHGYFSQRRRFAHTRMMPRGNVNHVRRGA